MGQVRGGEGRGKKSDDLVSSDKAVLVVLFKTGFTVRIGELLR